MIDEDESIELTCVHSYVLIMFKLLVCCQVNHPKISGSTVQLGSRDPGWMVEIEKPVDPATASTTVTPAKRWMGFSSFCDSIM